MLKQRQNRTIKTWDEIVQLVAYLDEHIREVVRRASETSDARVNPPMPTFRRDGSRWARDPEAKTPPTHNDPTGERAVRVRLKAVQFDDRIERAVETIATNLANARNFAKWMVEDLPDTTQEAIVRSIPQCEACGRPVFGKVKSGYDMECYERKRYLRITDRLEFKRVRCLELASLEDDE